MDFKSFFMLKSAETVFFTTLLYIFILFGRKRSKIFIKAVFIFITAVPLIFTTLYFTNTYLSKALLKSKADIIFPRPNEFHENPDYSIYVYESGKYMIKKGIFISKSKENKIFTEIKNTKVRNSGKNSFYIKKDGKELLFTLKPENTFIINSFFNIISKLQAEWRKEAGENSILLFIKISVFIFYVLTIAAAFNISLFPLVNFTFYTAAVFPVIYFLTIYKRIILPEKALQIIPYSAADSRGYVIIAALSLIIIAVKFISIIFAGKKKK